MEINQKDKKEYELGYLVKEEAHAAPIVAAVKAMGAEVRLEGPVNRIHLAYEIKKEQEAFFGYIQFMAEPAKVKELEATLGLNKDVLRSLIMTPPPMKEKKRMESIEGGPRPSASPRPVRAGRTGAGDSKPAAVGLSNEALEKKIEEILQ